MQKSELNRLETHFPGVRCTVVTSQLAEKNIRRISFVSGSSHSTTSLARRHCTILDRVRRGYAFEVRSVADFRVSPSAVFAETMLSLCKWETSYPMYLLLRRRKVLLKAVAVIVLTSQFYLRKG